MGMPETGERSAGGTAAVSNGRASSRAPLAAGVTVVVLALGLLAWAKYLPYSVKVPHVLDTHSLGASILTGDGAVGQGASLAAGWHFAVAYLSSVWQALVAGLVLAAAVQALLPATWLQRALGRSGGTRGGIRGALWSVLTLMCSCCAAPVAVGLRRLRANLPATVGFWLGNPALNPVVIVFVLGAFRSVLFPLDAAVPGVAVLAVSLAIAGLLLPVPTGGEVAVVAAGLAAGMPVPAAAVLLVTLPMLSLPSVLMVRSVVPRRVLERTAGAALGVGLLAAAVAPVLA